jgi:hypothetical protein
MAAADDLAEPSQLPARRSTRWRWAIAAAVATAAVAIVAIIVRPSRGGDEGDIAAKDAPITLTIHRVGGSLANGDVVMPGQGIRFEVHTARKGYVAIVGLDGFNKTTVYYPNASNVPAAFDPATAAVLPAAIRLDETPGDQRFYAVYADEPFSIDAVAAAMRERRPLPAGVVATAVVLRKAAK